MKLLHDILNFEFDSWARTGAGHIVGACTLLLLAGLFILARSYFLDFSAMTGLDRIAIGGFLICIALMVVVLFRIAYRLIKGIE